MDLTMQEIYENRMPKWYIVASICVSIIKNGSLWSTKLYVLLEEEGEKREEKKVLLKVVFTLLTA